jgi:hypothetical protein
MEIREMSKEEKIARACHEVNRAYCQALGDNSQVSWEIAPDWQRASAINGVRAHLEAGPMGLSPGASHVSWLEEKARDGWKYGPVKDAEKKEHPCFVEYHNLPLEHQAKDYIFGAVVYALRDWA